MRKLLVVALVAISAPSVSRAQLEVGARVGYAAALGNAVASSGEKTGMKDYSLAGQIPLQLDVVGHLTRELSVGGYLGYGFGRVDDAYMEEAAGGVRICSLIECTGSAWRAGVQGFYRFVDAGTAFLPWLGLSAGYESATTKASGRGVSMEVTLTGYELGLQAGGDFRVSDGFAVGPYVGLTFGQFNRAKLSATINGQSASDSGSIDEKAWHEWLSFGLRGTFTL